MRSRTVTESGKSVLYRLLLPCALGLFVFRPPAAGAAVQVTGLADGNVASNSTTVTGADGQSGPGIVDTLCIVNTNGGIVNLTFSSSNTPAADNQSWRATNLSTGASVRYRLSIAYYPDGGNAKVVSAVGQGNYAVAAGRAVVSAAACGTGNLKKTVVLIDPLDPGAGSFRDVVTILATPQ